MQVERNLRNKSINSIQDVIKIQFSQGIKVKSFAVGRKFKKKALNVHLRKIQVLQLKNSISNTLFSLTRDCLSMKKILRLFILYVICYIDYIDFHLKLQELKRKENQFTNENLLTFTNMDLDNKRHLNMT